MVRFSPIALVALLAAHEASAFGVVQHHSAFHQAQVALKTATQLNAEGSKILMPALSSTMKEGKIVTC